MTIMERFRNVLGNEQVDEILDTTTQTQDELDAAGKERKDLTEPVDEALPENDALPEDAPEQDAPEEGEDIKALQSFIDGRIDKALERFADAVVADTTKAVDEERATMQKQIDKLESMIIDIEDENDANSQLMPRAMQAARQRASKSDDTVIKPKNAPPLGEDSTFALGSLVVDSPRERR